MFIIPTSSSDCTFLGHYNNTGMAFTIPEYYSILKYISKYEKELEQIPPHVKTRLAKMKSVKKSNHSGRTKMTNVTLRKRMKNIDTMRKRIALRQMLNLNVVKE